MFDMIDAAYYRLRAEEEREKAREMADDAAETRRRRAALFEKRASALLNGPDGVEMWVTEGQKH